MHLIIVTCLFLKYRKIFLNVNESFIKNITYFFKCYKKICVIIIYNYIIKINMKQSQNKNSSFLY